MKHTLILITALTAIAGTTRSEPVHVTCPAEPPSVRRLQLKERWRVDVDSPEAPVWGYTYGNQVLSHAGRFYLLDAQLCNVHVFDRDGAYIGRIMGEGEGPGEIRSPGPMFVCRDGRLAVQFGFPSKLEFVDFEGNPVGRWRLQANAYAVRLQDTPYGWFGVYMESKQVDDPGVSLTELHVALHDAEGRRTEEFHSASRKKAVGAAMDEEEEFVPWFTAVAVGDGGILYSSRRNEYRLEWRNRSGEVTRVATRPYRSHRRTPAELEVLKYRSYRVSNDDFSFTDMKLSPFDPVINAIDVLAGGGLRVRTSMYQKELPDGMVCRFEVHAATGELRERVEIWDPTGSFDSDYDVIALLENDCAVVLRNVTPASRAATDARLHPKVREKLPPVPDEREDIVFVPIVCDLVPYAGAAGAGVKGRH